ncbi:MAG: NAD-dependent epimerase/dehydratase family protein [Polyangiales bacterium]
MSDAQRPGVALITGASGFIGGRLRDSLLDDGYDVVALVRPGSPEPKRGRAAAIDYAEPESLRAVLAQERPELVFHVAGATKGVHYEDFQRGNVMPTRNLLEAVAQTHPGLRRFVHISSLAAYGPSTPDPVQEHHERKPIEHYGKSKLEAEQVLEALGDAVPWTMIRPPTVYGPGDVDNLELFRLAMRHLNVFYGNRERPMSFVFVDDLVRGIRTAATHEATRSRGYFLCDGRPLTWGEYQQYIVEQTGRRALDLNLPGLSLHVAAFFGELATKLDQKPRLFNRQKVLMAQQSWTCRHDRAATDFGYAPTVPVEEGLRRTFEWYRMEGWI